MIGAIIGDVVGSVYEFNNIKTKDFPLFSNYSTYTDDTITTVALADCLINNGMPFDYLQKYCNMYDDPAGGYGGMFADWVFSDKKEPYNSYGNGAAMRISPVGYAFNDWDLIKEKTIEYTSITHNHPKGIEGALCVSEAIFEGRNRSREGYPNKQYLVDLLLKYYPTYDISETVDTLRPYYRFNETCQGTVPQAITCVIYSTSFEDAIKNAISIGGDSDTLACITGAIAEAFYEEIPDWIIHETFLRIPEPFLTVIDKFKEKYDYRI